MREKLLELMKNEGLKPSQLAEMLEINPAGISHILAGRNKPGFDLLQKILRRFPRVNPDWLMLDSGSIYRNTETSSSNSPHSASTSAPIVGVRSNLGDVESAPYGTGRSSTIGNLFDTNSSSARGGSTATRPTDSSANSQTNFPPNANRSSEAAAWNSSAESIASERGVAVKRIVILFDDATFESFTPARH